MPNPKDYKDQESFMAVCVPKLREEGKEQDQAVAACSSMWERRDMAATNARVRIVSNAHREVTKGGKTFLVVPGVPLREQVLNNYLVPAEEIERSAVSWNGTPITVNHPKTNNGSVNVPNPDVAIIGHFYNARWEPGYARMTGEYWIDVEEALKWEEGEVIVKNIKAGKVLETSTGYYADEELTAGDFNGRVYETIHRNILNDHIAILTSEVGACSVKDGCGVNRNVKLNQCDCDCPFRNEESLDAQLMEVRAAFEKQFIPRGNDANLSPSYLWIREIFDGHVIVEDSSDLYRVNYGRDPEGNPTFSPRDQWQKVEVQYVATNAENAIPDYQADHLPRVMLEGYCFNKGSRTPEQIESLRTYIKENGIDKPVTVMRMDDGVIKIVDGNHRVSMAGEFDIEQIPVRVFNEQLQPVDPELMYREWAHKEDQGYLNSESRSSTSTTVSTNLKEPSMKLQDLFSFLQGKGIKVKQNADGEFVVEEPTTPAAGPVPDAPSLSADDIAALKSLAALAPTVNALDKDAIEALKGVKVVANFAKNLEEKEKADREQLIAGIKANATNVYSDEELAGMGISILTKLNAQMNMSYAGLGGPQLVTNADDEPLSMKPVLLSEEEKE